MTTWHLRYLEILIYYFPTKTLLTYTPMSVHKCYHGNHVFADLTSFQIYWGRDGISRRSLWTNWWTHVDSWPDRRHHKFCPWVRRFLTNVLYISHGLQQNSARRRTNLGRQTRKTTYSSRSYSRQFIAVCRKKCVSLHRSKSVVTIVHCTSSRKQ